MTGKIVEKNTEKEENPLESAYFLSNSRIKTLCNTQVRQAARKLNAAIKAFLGDKAADGQHFATDREFGQRGRIMVSASGHDQSSELSNGIAAAIEGIEELLRPHMGRS